MKEITDAALAELRASLSVCNPLVQSLVRRLERVEGELQGKEAVILALSLKADSWETAALNARRTGEGAGKLIAEIEAEYNQKTNALIKRHADQITALRERVKRMEEAAKDAVRSLRVEDICRYGVARRLEAALKERE